jgi:BASS family bile acid:Na+ symporter
MERNLFLPTALLMSVGALAAPSLFTWAKPSIVWLLGVIMFGMGLTLEVDDFKKVWQHRRLVWAGVALQYTLMPLLAIGFGTALGLPDEMIVGLVLVGACPGGTASNVIVYLAGANIALSVCMTLASTVLAPFLTPLWVHALASQTVDVNMWAMMKSVFWIVIFPVFDGIVLRRFLVGRIDSVLRIFPMISMVAISFVIGIIVALNQAMLLTFPWLVMLAVILHNLSGLACGYIAAGFLRCSEKDRRTLAIEVGMQNSGLGVSLATTFFSAATALPGAIFSLWHNLSGIALAGYWRGRGDGFEGLDTADIEPDGQ